MLHLNFSWFATANAANAVESIGDCPLHEFILDNNLQNWHAFK
jgi:hypothetical protein